MNANDDKNVRRLFPAIFSENASIEINALVNYLSVLMTQLIMKRMYTDPQYKNMPRHQFEEEMGLAYDCIHDWVVEMRNYVNEWEIEVGDMGDSY
jgi:hypothetical protein